MKDLKNEILVSPCINPAVILNGNATSTGATVDTAGYDSLVFAVYTGAVTDGSFSVKLYHDDAAGMGTETEVSATDLNDALPSFADTDDNEVQYVGYRGSKRYVRIKVTQAGAAVGAYMCAFAIQGHSHSRPV